MSYKCQRKPNAAPSHTILKPQENVVDSGTGNLSLGIPHKNVYENPGGHVVDYRVARGIILVKYMYKVKEFSLILYVNHINEVGLQVHNLA